MVAIDKNESVYDVIVAGAGPTGLMLACELQLTGVRVAVLERRAHGTAGESRAPGINARTMELFRMRGLAAKFEEAGQPLPAVLFSGMPMLPKALDPAWPNALILPQHQTERLLMEHALSLGVSFHWSTELLYFTQSTDAVDIVVQQQGQLKNYTAKYLAGCDGGNSVVRRICGERFTGLDPVAHWIVADVQLANPPAENERFGRNLRIGTYQVSSVEKDWFRVSLMKVTPPLDRSAPVTLAELRQAMQEGIGTDFGLQTARWMSRFGDGFRQVTQYRYQRVFLLGDAAHTHSPIGGQGLNLGIQDAMNLGWKLGRVVRGEAPDQLLDTFEQERHPVGSAVLASAMAQTALIKPGVQNEALRSVVSSMLAVPAVTLQLARQLSGLGVRYSWGDGQHPLVGQRVPNFAFRTDTGETDLFSLMRAGRPLLLQFGQHPPVALPETYRSQVDVIAGDPIVELTANGWKLAAVDEVPALCSAFIRPDGFVAWAQPLDQAFDGATLSTALAHWLGIGNS